MALKVVRRIVGTGVATFLATTMLLACEGGVSPTPSSQASPAETITEPGPTAAPTFEPNPTPVPFEAPTPGTTATWEGAVATGTTVASDTWRGIEVAPEYRCALYDSDDYPYSQSVEQRIVAGMGGIIYGPYTGTWFTSTSETDIEHIVARSEAHDSGLCAADTATRRQFAADLLNLTLASPASFPLPQEREGRGRVALEPKPLLVCGPRSRGAPALFSHHRPA